VNRGSPGLNYFKAFLDSNLRVDRKINRHENIPKNCRHCYRFFANLALVA